MMIVLLPICSVTGISKMPSSSIVPVNVPPHGTVITTVDPGVPVPMIVVCVLGTVVLLGVGVVLFTTMVGAFPSTLATQPTLSTRYH
jgi:hypothetical protein